mgnify:CR=1 FL=1
MKIISYILGLAIVFFAGLKLGFYLAPTEFIYRDAQYKSSAITFEIKALKAGEIDTIIESKEIMLDGELANHGRYLKSNLSWLLYSIEEENHRAISKAAKYRAENPFTGPDHTKPETWKPGVDMNSTFVKKVIQGQKENEKLKKMVIEKYAN